MELQDLHIFAHVAELLSISGAARALSTPKSTVSRSLVRLERDTGTALVDRSTRHLRLTDAGIILRAHAGRVLDAVDGAETAIDEYLGVPRGTLRLSVPFTLAVTLIAPMLPAFIAAYPSIRIVVDIENRVIDMPVEPVDLVIRVGALRNSELIARRLLTTEVWTCASPAYLAAQGIPATVAELGSHRLVAEFDRCMRWSYRSGSGVTEQIDFIPSAVIPDSTAILPMILGDAGIARLPDFLARRAVAEGTLTRVLPDWRGDLFDIHAVYASHRSLTAKMRIFIDALVAHIADTRFATDISQ